MKAQCWIAVRKADHAELITEAVSSQTIPASGANDLDPASLANVFGIDIDKIVATLRFSSR